MNMGVVERILKPIIVGLRHVFTKPITVKYPFTKLENVQEESYFYDPKVGVAVPGYKGRHLLHMDKCIGCASCDLTCQNVAEAITMVYGFDVELEFDEEFAESLRAGGAAAELVLKLSSPFGAHKPRIERGEEGYRLRLNWEPIWECKADFLYENLLLDVVWELERGGWRFSEEKKAPDAEEYLVSGHGVEARLLIKKRDLGYKQNRRSVFPAVDYGRCVFCGFCVEACPSKALEMIKDYELSSLAREELFYNPLMLASRELTTPPPESTWAEKLVMVLRRYR